MKYRALSGSEVVVSEVGYAIATTPGADSLQSARLARLAYDEGVNFFLLPASSLHDGILAHAFSALRSKIVLAASILWPGAAAFERLQAAVEFRLAGLATDRIDVLFLRGVPADRILDGTVADAIHRLRTSGKVRTVGHSESGGLALTARDLARSGASVVEFTPLPSNGFMPGFDRFPGGDEISAVARVSAPALAAAGDLSFLWNDTGRTRSQAVISLALSSPSVSTAVVSASSDEELREAARAPLSPTLTEAELSAARVDRRPVTSGA